MIKTRRGNCLDVICFGGLGGRVDQGLSQLHQLYTLQGADYSSGRLFLISPEAISFILKSGVHRIKIRDSTYGNDTGRIGLGKHIGIIPLREPSVITTKGLEWDVTDWVTMFGGQMSTSNAVREDWALIKTTKDVLFTIHLVVSNTNDEKSPVTKSPSLKVQG